MALLTTSLVASLALFLVAVSLLLWKDAVKVLRAGRPMVKFEPRRLVPWGCIDLFLVFLVFLTVESCFAAVWLGDIDVKNGLDTLSGAQQARLLFVHSIATMVGLMLVLCLLRFKSKATVVDFGFLPEKIVSDIKLGAAAFCMLSVPVYGIQMLLTLFIEPEHPIMRLLESEEAGRFWIAFGAAVVVAPLAEELIFRVILQAWFENVAHFLDGINHPRPPLRFLFHGRVGNPRINPEPPLDDVNGSNYLVDQVDAADSEVVVNQMSLWPVVVSSAIFAAMHLGQGPAPIPLFVLALGLGYLYHRTHRVTPCIVVHLMLNGTSLLSIWVSAE